MVKQVFFEKFVSSYKISILGNAHRHYYCAKAEEVERLLNFHTSWCKQLALIEIYGHDESNGI